MQRENDSLTLIERYKQLHSEIEAFLGFDMNNAPIDENFKEGGKWCVMEGELRIIKGTDEYAFNISHFTFEGNTNFLIKRDTEHVFICAYQETWRDCSTIVLRLDNEVTENEYDKLQSEL